MMAIDTAPQNQNIWRRMGIGALQGGMGGGMGMAGGALGGMLKGVFNRQRPQQQPQPQQQPGMMAGPLLGMGMGNTGIGGGMNQPIMGDTTMGGGSLGMGGGTNLWDNYNRMRNPTMPNRMIPPPTY